MPRSFDEDWLVELRLRTSVATAKKGKSSGTLDVLRLFVEHNDAGSEVPTEVKEFLVEAFRSVLAGEKRLDEALNTKGKRGGVRRRAMPWLIPEIQDAFLILEVSDLRKAGKSFQDAVADVADSYDELSESTVARAWRKRSTADLDNF